jgi:predicted Fe-Mo cluster-binding NifX family protein
MSTAQQTTSSPPPASPVENHFRVAVTTTDGVTVNRHFGRATEFHIYEINGRRTHFVEVRNLSALCDTLEHDWELLAQIAGQLTDCAVILTAQIGPPVLRRLEQAHFHVLTTEGPIRDFVDRIARSPLARSYSKGL